MINSNISGNHLKQFIEKIETLEEQKKDLSNEISDILVEAKSVGFDIKAIREIIKMRKLDENERKEREEIIDLYVNAINKC